MQHPELAYQISIKHNIHGHFHRSHLKTLHAISQLPRFLGTLSPGISERIGLSESGSSPIPIIPSHLCHPQPPQASCTTEPAVDDDEGLEDKVGANEGMEKASHTLQDMFITCANETNSIALVF